MPSNSSSRDHSPLESKKRRKPGKIRLDVLLVERGLAPSREKAQALLLAGQVRVNGQPMEKPGGQVPVDAKVDVAGPAAKYSSRGGIKLEGALRDFALAPAGKICLDIGSSTGGFTDCLLQNGAQKVYAVDVTVNQLDWKLRSDPRVVQVERNARFMKKDDTSDSAGFVVMDLSFISATKVLPAIVPLAEKGAEFLILIKPQFELEKADVAKGGIVRSPDLHKKAIERVARAAEAAGLDVLSTRPSCIKGAEGNQEFFLHARRRE